MAQGFASTRGSTLPGSGAPLLTRKIELTGNNFEHGFDVDVFMHQTELFGFSLKDKILGPDDGNIKYLEESGAQVSLRGKGSDDGSDAPMHILIEAPSQEQLQLAFRQAEDLVASVREDWIEWENEHRDYKEWLDKFRGATARLTYV